MLECLDSESAEQVSDTKVGDGGQDAPEEGNDDSQDGAKEALQDGQAEDGADKVTSENRNGLDKRQDNLQVGSWNDREQEVQSAKDGAEELNDQAGEAGDGEDIGDERSEGLNRRVDERVDLVKSNLEGVLQVTNKLADGFLGAFIGTHCLDFVGNWAEF